MTIHYWDGKFFREQDLESLFLSVGWKSGKHPAKLARAMANSDWVVSAWDGERLVGLVNALSDGVMTAYMHYVLVHPEYQGQGIGKKLIDLMVQHYGDYLRMVLVSYHNRTGFYEQCGFAKNAAAQAMEIARFQR